MARTFCIVLLGALGLFVSAPEALAQGDAPAASAEAKAEARELANKGFALFQEGNFKEAVQYFRDADAKFHAPTLLLMQAKAHEKIGQLIEARGLYSQIAREPMAADASKEFKQARSDAEDALGKMKGRIPKLKIVLKGGTADKVQLSIDDVPIASSLIGKPIEQNPGLRKVVATIETPEGGRSVFQSVTLREGRIKQIQIVLKAGGTAAVSSSAEDEAVDTEASGGSAVPMGLSFGLGAAALGAGVVTGVLWLNEKDHIKEKCPNGDECAAAQPNINKAGTLGIVSIVGLSAGAVGMALGTVFAVTRKSGPNEEARAGVTSVAVGPGSLLVRGVF